ncbi:MAG: hypothetical protein HC794_10810 [Nitrospiraceae bacterium]|nr:hypothetical protein [Nitrospiraceae bacterium]
MWAWADGWRLENKGDVWGSDRLNLAGDFLASDFLADGHCPPNPNP